MNRDELILDCEEIVDNLVRKYNNHKLDEDLHSTGMIAVIECVDRCLSENMTDKNQILARCNLWARNRILDVIYKKKIKYSDDENAIDMVVAPEDDSLLIIAIRQELTDRQREVFDELCLGRSDDEICANLNIGKIMLDNHKRNIKKKIKTLDM